MKNETNATKIAVAELTLAIFPEAVSDTSKKIRYLSSIGYSTSEIEKALIHLKVTTKQGGAIRYQHVRNVLNTNLVSK